MWRTSQRQMVQGHSSNLRLQSIRYDLEAGGQRDKTVSPIFWVNKIKEVACAINYCGNSLSRGTSDVFYYIRLGFFVLIKIEWGLLCKILRRD